MDQFMIDDHNESLLNQWKRRKSSPLPLKPIQNDSPDDSDQLTHESISKKPGERKKYRKRLSTQIFSTFTSPFTYIGSTIKSQFKKKDKNPEKNIDTPTPQGDPQNT